MFLTSDKENLFRAGNGVLNIKEQREALRTFNEVGEGKGLYSAFNRPQPCHGEDQDQDQQREPTSEEACGNYRYPARDGISGVIREPPGTGST
jgi:hypothetical protein